MHDLSELTPHRAKANLAGVIEGSRSGHSHVQANACIWSHFPRPGRLLKDGLLGWGLLNRGLQCRPAQRTCAVSPLMAVNARHIERRVQKNRGAEAVRMFRI